MEAHWENSSSNAIIRDILEDATDVTKAEIEALISGEAVEKEIIPELTYTGDDRGTLTTHKMFKADTQCPGPYLEGRLGHIAGEVTRRLKAEDQS